MISKVDQKTSSSTKNITRDTLGGGGFLSMPSSSRKRIEDMKFTEEDRVE
jgi:hypothetical protein